MVVTTQIFFTQVRSNYHLYDWYTNCSCAQLNKFSTFKKLGKLIVVIVPHNSGNRCISGDEDIPPEVLASGAAMFIGTRPKIQDLKKFE